MLPSFMVDRHQIRNYLVEVGWLGILITARADKRPELSRHFFPRTWRSVLACGAPVIQLTNG